MKKLTPLAKGLITGALMLGTTLILTKLPPDSNIQYLVYALYAGGIIWTLLDFARSPRFTGKFSELFGQGFRCFVVVALIMVSFVGVYSYLHPEIAEKQAQLDREYLKQQKDVLPHEIEPRVQKAKDKFVVTNMYSAVFGFMIIGTIFTLAGSILVLMRKK